MLYHLTSLHKLWIAVIAATLFCSCEYKTTNTDTKNFAEIKKVDTFGQSRTIKFVYLRDRFGDTIKFSHYEKQSTMVYVIDGRKFIVPKTVEPTVFSKNYLSVKFQPIRLKISSQKVRQYLDTLLLKTTPKKKLIVSEQWLKKASAYHQKILPTNLIPIFLEEGYEKMTYFAFYEKNMDKDEEREIILIAQFKNQYSKSLIILDKEKQEWLVKSKHYQE